MLVSKEAVGLTMTQHMPSHLLHHCKRTGQQKDLATTATLRDLACHDISQNSAVIAQVIRMLDPNVTLRWGSEGKSEETQVFHHMNLKAQSEYIYSVNKVA